MIIEQTLSYTLAEIHDPAGVAKELLAVVSLETFETGRNPIEAQRHTLLSDCLDNEEIVV